MNNVDIGYVFTTVLAFFLIMLVGAATRVFGVLDWQTTKKLSGFVVNVAQPLLIICAFQTEYTSDKLKIGLSLIGVGAVLLVIASLFARLFSKLADKGESGVFEFGLVFANWTYLSYPILVAIFGSVGYFYGAFFTLLYNVYIRLYGVLIINRGKKGSRPLVSALLNPGTIAAVIGIALFLLKISLPAFLLDSFKIVGDMTFPLSMIIVGSLMCNQPLKNIFKKKLYLFASIKLILFPMMAIIVCTLMHELFGFDRGLAYICVVMTCLPTSADTALYSEIYKSNSPLGASYVCITTLISVVTIPAAIWLTSLLI